MLSVVFNKYLYKRLQITKIEFAFIITIHSQENAHIVIIN